MKQQAKKLNSSMPGQIHLHAPIKSLRIPSPKYVLGETSILDTVELMKSFKIGSIIVVDEYVRLLGIATERDFLMKVMGPKMDLKRPIDSIMTKNPQTLTLDDTLFSAIVFMTEGGYRHVPIVNEINSPVGMVSIKDLMGHIYESM